MLICGAALGGLLADIVAHPILYETTKKADLDVSKVLSEQIYLGNLQGHRIYVTSGDLSDEDFMAKRRNIRSTLVVPVYVEEDGEDGREHEPGGAVLKVVMERLRSASPENFARMRQTLDHFDMYRQGDAALIELDTRKVRAATFAFDSIIMVSLPVGKVKEKHIQSAFRDVYSKASGIHRLVIPPVAIRLDGHKSELPISRVYHEVLSSLPEGTFDVEFHVYTAWPTLMLESLAKNFNSAWHSRVGLSDKGKIYNIYMRSGLLSFAILIAISTRLINSLRDVLMLGTVFLVGLFGAKSLADMLNVPDIAVGVIVLLLPFIQALTLNKNEIAGADQ